MWIKTTYQLPPEGKYVLGRHNRGTWHDSDDQPNVNCVVVKMKCGISVLDREKMERGEIENPKVGPNWCLSEGYTYSLRSKMITSDDEWGNNTVPYSFHTFGPGHYFGQTITHWQPIEDAPQDNAERAVQPTTAA